MSRYVDSRGRDMYPHEVGGTVVDDDFQAEKVSEGSGEVSEGIEVPADGVERESELLVEDDEDGELLVEDDEDDHRP